jgi:hypothetical protein
MILVPEYFILSIARKNIQSLPLMVAAAVAPTGNQQSFRRLATNGF